MIPTRNLGPGAPELPVVGFGGMPLSITGRPDETTAVAVLHASMDAGMRLLDTADVYCLSHTDIGHNERIFAKAVATWSGDRDSVVIATKGGLVRPDGRWERDARPEQLRQACDRSLMALGVERIELYQLHAPDPNVPLDESVGAIADLQKEGKIRWVGLSNVSVQEIEKARAILTVVTVQNRLNPFFREAIDDGVVQHCAKHGIGFLAYSPVGGGRLHKKLPDHATVGKIADQHDALPHEVVLAWVLAQGPNVFIIPGARSERNALSSVRAAELQLTPDEIDLLNHAHFSRD